MFPNLCAGKGGAICYAPRLSINALRKSMFSEFPRRAGANQLIFINIVAYASENYQLVYFHQHRGSNRSLPRFHLCFHTHRGSDHKFSFPFFGACRRRIDITYLDSAVWLLSESSSFADKCLYYHQHRGRVGPRPISEHVSQHRI